MILKVNLAASVVFALASVGVLLFGSAMSQQWTSGDLWIVLFFLSPALLWAAGARVVRGRRWSSSLWLVASALFLGIELSALILEAIKNRQEAITGEYTQSIVGFLTVLLQWAVGLPLLAILAVFAKVLHCYSRPKPGIRREPANGFEPGNSSSVCASHEAPDELPRADELA
jgi:hypothetical protein